jgi:hypothetical protein
MQKSFQTGASIALKVAVFGFTEYLQSWKLECFVALLLPCFAEIYNTKASKIKQSIDSHFTAYPDQTEHKLLAAVQTVDCSTSVPLPLRKKYLEARSKPLNCRIPRR